MTATTSTTTKNTINKQAILDQYTKYLALSSFLFKKSDTYIYNINEVPVDSPFYEDAQSVSKKLKVNWNTMSHANSNRVMLALLEQYFQSMQDIESNTSCIVDIKIKLCNNEDKGKV